MQYSFNEITLIPERLTEIRSRKGVSPFVFHKLGSKVSAKLPVFISPMTCLLDKNNYDEINLNSPFIPVLPVTPDVRNYTQDLSSGWRACTVSDFKAFVEQRSTVVSNHYQICIDCANGHMKEVYDLVSKFKKYHPNSEIMTGNIANPDTYLECCKAGIDYVRVGIGGGSGCTTSVQTGFHASLPWLLSEICKLKDMIKQGNMYELGQRGFTLKDIVDIQLKPFTKIVADGGINEFHKIVKALALGADYVMIGKMFAETDAACTYNPRNVTYANRYYGQASRQGQLDRFGEVRSNPEGVETLVCVQHNLKDFSKKVEDVLRCAMSYANTTILDEFVGKVKWDIQSAEEFNSYNK